MNMLNKARIAIVVALTNIFLPISVFAGGNTTLGLKNPIKFDNLTAFLMEMLRVVVQYSVLLIVFFLVYAGFQFVTAQGNSEKITKARQMFIWIVIGAFVILGVYVIRAAICGTVGQLSGDPTKPICAQ